MENKEYVYAVLCHWRQCENQVFVFKSVDDAVLFALRTAIQSSRFEDDFEIKYDKENELHIQWHFEGYDIVVSKEELR